MSHENADDNSLDAARMDLLRRMATAARGTSDEIKPLVKDPAEDVLRALAANPNLDEEDLLLLLERRDLPVDLIRQLANDQKRMGAYRVKLAILRNPKAPASVTLKFVHQIHLFDLVGVSLIPHVPREIKAAIDNLVLGQLKQIPLGARITLARRTGSEAVISRLVLDRELPVAEAALTNARLTEASIVRALRDPSVPPHTVDLISRSQRWSVRHDVRFALLRNRHTPLSRALTYLQTMTREDLRTLARDGAVPAQLRGYITKSLASAKR